MKLTVLTDRSGDRSVVRFREVHALAAGETYSPLVVDGVPGADLATLQVKLYRPSETLPSPAVQDPPLAVSLSPAERVMDGVAMTTLQLNSQAIADWYSDVLSSAPSPSSASSTSPGLRPADFTSRVATAILEISDASHGVWTYAPVPLILRPLAVGLPVVGVDGQDGVSPTVTLSRFSGAGGSGVTISVTDASGTSTESVYDGQPPVAPSASAAGVPADAAATYEAVAAKADAAALAAEAAARRAADSALSARIDALPDPYAKSETYSRSQVDTLLSAKQAALDGDQMAAVDSGVTSSTVAAVSTLQAAVASKASSADLSTAVSRISAAETRLDAIIAAGPVYPDPETGKINERFLPSYVDDVIEAARIDALPAQGEPGKIYVALDTNLTYRWSGSAYVEISQSLALGETASTAFPGNRGRALEDGKAEKGEMSVTPGTGADADKVTIQLKTGASATVLTQHSPVDPTLTAGGTNAVQGRAVKAAIDAKCSIADVTAVAQAPWTLECGNPDTSVRFGSGFYEDPAAPSSPGPLHIIYFGPPSGSDATSYSVTSPYGGVEWAEDLENPEWSSYMAYTLSVDDGEGAQFSGQATPAADGSAVVQLAPVLPEGVSMPSWWADMFGSSLTLRRAASVNVNGLARLVDLPTKTSDLVNDSGFLTSHQELRYPIVTVTSDANGVAHLQDMAVNLVTPMVTALPPVWEWSDGLDHGQPVYGMIYDDGEHQEYGWGFSGEGDTLSNTDSLGNYYEDFVYEDSDATELSFHDYNTDDTIVASLVTQYETDVSSLALPPAVAGRSRDFMVRLAMPENAAMFSWPSGVEYETEDGQMPDVSEPGVYLLAFTETGVGRLALMCRKVQGVE